MLKFYKSAYIVYFHLDSRDILAYTAYVMKEQEFCRLALTTSTILMLFSQRKYRPCCQRVAAMCRHVANIQWLLTRNMGLSRARCWLLGVYAVVILLVNLQPPCFCCLHVIFLCHLPWIHCFFFSTIWLWVHFCNAIPVIELGIWVVKYWFVDCMIQFTSLILWCWHIYFIYHEFL